jgi:DNA-directed RNA polymerase specialized sigma24 family protein
MEPEDLVQRALLVLPDGRLAWDDDATMTVARMFTAISNDCKNMRRKVAKRGLPPGHIMGGEGRRVMAAPNQDVRIDVHESIARLPAGSREVLLACIMEDQHPAMYARATGVSAKTVRNQIGLAKSTLRHLLSGYAHPGGMGSGSFRRSKP